MNLKKAFALLLSFFALSTVLTAANRADYNLVTDIGSSAQMISIGQIEGFVNGPSVLMDNAAGLHRQEKKNAVSLFSTTLIGEVHYTLLAYGRKTQKWGTFGIAMMDAKVFDIPHTATTNSGSQGETFVSTGQFNYTEAVYKLAHAYSLSDKWHLGSAVVVYNKNFYDVKASGYNVDLGAMYTADDFELSFSARNVLLESGVGYTRNSDKNYGAYEKIPFQFVTSGKYKFEEVNLYAQTKWQNADLLLGFGADYRNKRIRNLVLSGGYKEYLVTNHIKGNYVVGVGLDLNGVRIQYAYEKGEHVDFDNKSYFSVDVQF